MSHLLICLSMHKSIICMCIYIYIYIRRAQLWVTKCLAYHSSVLNISMSSFQVFILGKKISKNLGKLEPLWNLWRLALTPLPFYDSSIGRALMDVQSMNSWQGKVMKRLEYVKQMACCFSVLLVGRCGKIILRVSQGFEYLKGKRATSAGCESLWQSEKPIRISFARI